jgi:hypothetical protein
MEEIYMKKKIFIFALILTLITMLVLPEIAEARGSFGGSRGFGGGRSFGGSRSASRSSSSRGSGLFGSSKSRSSFGGTKSLSSRGAYTAKYGTPRKSMPANQFNGSYGGRIPSNYMVHSYGGYSNGLMTGYLLGHTSWMWMTPFHPAFYYSRPYYVNNPDGTVGVYPPTFSFGNLLLGLIIIFGIIWILRKIFRRRKSAASYNTSSSFG